MKSCVRRLRKKNERIFVDLLIQKYLLSINYVLGGLKAQFYKYCNLEGRRLSYEDIRTILSYEDIRMILRKKQNI